MTDERPDQSPDESPMTPLSEVGAEVFLNPDPDEHITDKGDEEEPWWQAEGMPWKKEPGREDIACLSWFGVVAVVGLLARPLRAAWLARHPDWLAMLLGSRTAVAATGALASVGQMDHWPVVLLVASILSLKFDWIYWWAGKLWGRGMIEVWAGTSPRAARNFERTERWAQKLGVLGFFIAYLPIPLPLMQVVFVVSGATGMSLRRFLLYDYLASTLFLVGYFCLGWWMGDPVVAFLDWYAKIANYVALALVVMIFFTAFSRAGKRQKTPKSA